MEWLEKDRARLNFLSMDFVSHSTGYCHATVMMCDGHDKWEVSSPTLRHAVDLLAEAIYGKDWVEKFAAFDWAPFIMDEHETTFDGTDAVNGQVEHWERVPDENGVIHQDTQWVKR